MTGMPGGFNFMGPGGHMDNGGMHGGHQHPGGPSHAMSGHPMQANMAGMVPNAVYKTESGHMHGVMLPNGMGPPGGVPSERTPDSEVIRSEPMGGAAPQQWGHEQPKPNVRAD